VHEVGLDEIRYLGVFITRSRKFKCSIDDAKRSFYHVANGIFGKVRRLASEEVVVQLLLHRCRLYAKSAICSGGVCVCVSVCVCVTVCALDKSAVQCCIQSLAINRFFIKLLRTSNIVIVREC